MVKWIYDAMEWILERKRASEVSRWMRVRPQWRQQWEEIVVEQSNQPQTNRSKTAHDSMWNKTKIQLAGYGTFENAESQRKTEIACTKISRRNRAKKKNKHKKKEDNSSGIYTKGKCNRSVETHYLWLSPSPLKLHTHIHILLTNVLFLAHES